MSFADGLTTKTRRIVSEPAWKCNSYDDADAVQFQNQPGVSVEVSDSSSGDEPVINTTEVSQVSSAGIGFVTTFQQGKRCERCERLDLPCITGKWAA